ncbi:MAG: AAA family ATPase [Acidimicrobiia bacterium]|nr:AAA family ATPase [Acidimicrobiia bacterium]
MSAAVSFLDTVRRARAYLQEQGRVSLSALEMEFDLDRRQLESLVEELVDVQCVASRHDNVLMWTGAPRSSELALEPEKSPVEPVVAASAERRTLSALFCDLVDSTRLAAGLDAEEWSEVVQAYQEAAVSVVERFDGHVGQYLGDGILVYFGWPRAHEDDAERAVRVGLGIVDCLEDLNPRLEAAGRPTLALRVGIHTGPVFVGEMGGGERRETQVLGDTMNLAARLQGIAEPDTVVVSQDTLRLVRGIFVAENLGPREIKGLEKPVVAYRVVQPSGVRSRLDLGAEKLTPLVGRDHELATLLDAWEHVCEGQGQAILVRGEAGVGKSRLVWALRDRMLDQDHTWLEGRCSPYAQNTAFFPVTELLTQGLVLGAGEAAEWKLRKLESGLKQAGLEVAETVPLFAPLVSIPVPDSYRQLEMSPELQRRKTLESLVAWSLALTDLQPVLLLVEDLHWADPSSLELLGMLIEQCPTARIMTVLTARPELEPTWSQRSHCRAVTLGRLARTAAHQMAASVTAGRPLPAGAVETILTRADGIPLYIEELARAVIESELPLAQVRSGEPGGDAEQIAVPMTLQQSLMSRLDKVPDAKQLAQMAAALGRDFSYRLLAAVAGYEDEALRANLAQLTEADILLQRGVPPDANYTFRHTLIQETAYDSLLLRTRRDLHGRIADVLKSSPPGVPMVEPELLAHHCDRAGRVEEAVEYYLRAGEAAHRHSANSEAIASLERALALLAELPDGTARLRRELAVQLTLAPVIEAAHGLASKHARESWERASELAETCGSPDQLFLALYGLANYDSVLEISGRLLAIAESTDDEAKLVAAHVRAGLPRFYNGRFRESLEHFKAAAAVYDPDKHHSLALTYGGDQGTIAYLFGAGAEWMLGYPDRASSELDQMLRHARELGDPYSLAMALAINALFQAALRQWDLCERLGREGVVLCDRHGFPLYLGLAKVVHALAVSHLRDEDTLIEANEGFAGAAASGAATGAPIAMWAIAGIHQNQGRVADALDAVDAGLMISDKTKQGFADVPLLLTRGELRLATDEEEAESLFVRALEVARAQEAKSFELRAATSLARLWWGQDKRAAARQELQPVYEWFTEGFSTLDLQDAKALLEEMA